MFYVGTFGGPRANKRFSYSIWAFSWLELCTGGFSRCLHNLPVVKKACEGEKPFRCYTKNVNFIKCVVQIIVPPCQEQTR
jgi:hypothetical protein